MRQSVTGQQPASQPISRWFWLGNITRWMLWLDARTFISLNIESHPAQLLPVRTEPGKRIRGNDGARVCFTAPYRTLGWTTGELAMGWRMAQKLLTKRRGVNLHSGFGFPFSFQTDYRSRPRAHRCATGAMQPGTKL